MVGEAYPKREGSHFAHRALRLLVKTAAAQEIGPTAVALVMTVAMTEDAARYRRAVTFYNDQLLPLVGVAKWDALDRARRKAVEAGWLHYEARGSRRPGIYWVTIPATADGLADGPVDEGSAVPEIPENGAQLEDRQPYITPENGAHTEPMVSVSGGNEGDDAGVIGGMKRGQWGGTSIPKTPSPSPSPNNPLPPLEAEVVSAWNATAGVHRCRRVAGKRLTNLRARCRDPAWEWRAALARFPLKLFASEPSGWQPNLDWFVRPDTVDSILEGKYDWSKSDGKPARGSYDSRAAQSGKLAF